MQHKGGQDSLHRTPRLSESNPGFTKAGTITIFDVTISVCTLVNIDGKCLNTQNNAEKLESTCVQSRLSWGH